MKKLILLLLFLSACTPKPAVVLPTATLTELAALSASCAGHSFASRGKAPIGYMKGMTLMYAKALCNQGSGVNKILTFPDNGAKDVFKQYGISPKFGVESLRSTYNILIGLGMRESSGRYCCGRDMSANFSSAEGAEAGLFQTSYNAHSVSSELDILFAKYKNDHSKCYLEVFSEGVKACSAGDLKNWGNGNGFEYQKLSKECPAFHTEFSAVVIRRLHNHFGPLKRKEAEPVCSEMLQSVEKFVSDHPDICEKL